MRRFTKRHALFSKCQTRPESNAPCDKLSQGPPFAPSGEDECATAASRAFQFPKHSWIFPFCLVLRGASSVIGFPVVTLVGSAIAHIRSASHHRTCFLLKVLPYMSSVSTSSRLLSPRFKGELRLRLRLNCRKTAGTRTAEDPIGSNRCFPMCAKI